MRVCVCVRLGWYTLCEAFKYLLMLSVCACVRMCVCVVVVGTTIKTPALKMGSVTSFATIESVVCAWREWLCVDIFCVKV